MRGSTPVLFNCVCGGMAIPRRGEVGWYVRCERDPGFASVTEYSSRKRAANAWNKAQEQMDGLSRDAVCAYHARKSYGQYIATMTTPQSHCSCDSSSDKGSQVEAPQLRCVCCGLVIPAGSTSNRYCSPACAERYREEHRLRMKNAGAADPSSVTACAATPSPQGGSDASAAGGGNSELSEWPGSARRKPALTGEAAAGDPNRNGMECEEVEDERPKCKECGAPIPKDSKRLKYCCGACADKAMERMKAEYARRRKLRGGAR